MTDKHLRIEYGGKVFYDAPAVGTFTWSENENGISLSVSGPKLSFLDALKAASERLAVTTPVEPAKPAGREPQGVSAPDVE